MKGVFVLAPNIKPLKLIWNKQNGTRSSKQQCSEWNALGVHKNKDDDQHLPNAIALKEAHVEDEVCACSNRSTGVDINLSSLQLRGLGWVSPEIKYTTWGRWVHFVFAGTLSCGSHNNLQAGWDNGIRRHQEFTSRTLNSNINDHLRCRGNWSTMLVRARILHDWWVDVVELVFLFFFFLSNDAGFLTCDSELLRNIISNARS
jgi:hypothetical protein